MRKELIVVVCAALSAQRIQDFVQLVLAAQWHIQLVVTPKAEKFVDRPLLEQLSGRPLLIAPSADAAPCSLAAQAVVVVPATYNTLKKWAQGQADTYALHLLCSWNPRQLPILAVPRASMELAQEAEFFPSLHQLKARGVHILYEPDRYPPNNAVPWHIVLDHLQAIYAHRPLETTQREQEPG